MNETLDFLLNFNSSNWINFSVRGVFIYLFILWAAVIVWVARDVVGRTRSLIFQVLAIILVIILNVFGLLIYLIIRPQKTLLEKYQEDIEQKALINEEEVCPHCARSLPLNFQFCPSCGIEVRQHCEKCHKLVSKNWSICPYCGKKKSAHKKIKLEVEKNKQKKKTKTF